MRIRMESAIAILFSVRIEEVHAGCDAFRQDPD